MDRTTAKPLQFEREMVGGEIYEYCPLGHYVVRAPEVSVVVPHSSIHGLR